MLLRFLILVSLMSASAWSYAQDVRELATDRPGLGSDAPVTVPQGFVQVEAGFQMDKDRYRQGNVELEQTLWSYPSTLLRYGILDRWEFRLSFDALSLANRRQNADLVQQLQGISPITLGSKVMLTQEEGWVPTMAFQFGLTLPSTGSEALQSTFTQPTITWLMTKSVTENFGITVNLGAEWDDISPAATYNYALSMDMSLQEKLGAFLEFYGSWPELGTQAHAVNYGLTYLMLDDLQLDISSGVGLVDEATDYFIGLGISGRIGL